MANESEMSRVLRVQVMEQRLNAASAAVKALGSALEEYERALPQLKALEEYYQSPLWLEDYDSDCAGKLPRDLPRGVLAEDTVDTLLWEDQRLRQTMLRLSTPRENE